MDTEQDQIEVTPEMLEAGVMTFLKFDPDDDVEQMVEAVFVEMRLRELPQRKACSSG